MLVYEEELNMYATEFSQVGANIQGKLDALGMTQQSLANALGVSKQVMHKIIKGAKAINVNELSKIAMILNTTADELLKVDNLSFTTNDLAFMGEVTDEEAIKKISIICTAIDEIHMLEELLND